MDASVQRRADALGPLRASRVGSASPGADPDLDERDGLAVGRAVAVEQDRVHQMRQIVLAAHGTGELQAQPSAARRAHGGLAQVDDESVPVQSPHARHPGAGGPFDVEEVPQVVVEPLHMVVGQVVEQVASHSRSGSGSAVAYSAGSIAGLVKACRA
jgi:hypothetical protein